MTWMILRSSGQLFCRTSFILGFFPIVSWSVRRCMCWQESGSWGGVPSWAGGVQSTGVPLLVTWPPSSDSGHHSGLLHSQVKVFPLKLISHLEGATLIPGKPSVFPHQISSTSFYTFFLFFFFLSFLNVFLSLWQAVLVFHLQRQYTSFCSHVFS